MCKGDLIENYSGQELRVEKIETEKLEIPVKVYNFEVDDFHTYYVGSDKLLVHNKCYVGNAGKTVISSIDKDKRLVRAAEQMGKNKDAQREANELVAQFLNGNTNPGIGNKNLFGNINYLRGANGARVFFRNTQSGIEILAKADKSNEDTVINILKQLYK